MVGHREMKYITPANGYEKTREKQHINCEAA
jgi:hypothetical protein